MLTQQQIIALAVEAGMHIAPNGTVHASQSELETLVYAAVAKETEARIKLQKEFMEYQKDMQARGTRLIKEAYQRGVRDEREARTVVFDDQQSHAVKLSHEWTPCVKLPVTVHVREQRQGETHISTREGITPILPSDLIMRGVMGEEYPIGRELFERTYRLGEADAQHAILACIDAEREACAITAWNHYMDECRKKNVHPADFGDWCAAAAIRARSVE